MVLPFFFPPARMIAVLIAGVRLFLTKVSMAWERLRIVFLSMVRSICWRMSLGRVIVRRSLERVYCLDFLVIVILYHTFYSIVCFKFCQVFVLRVR